MNEKTKLSELVMAFCICTTGITILEGVLGMLIYPDELVPYNAFLTPPMFGLISVLLGIVTWSKKELTVKQILIKRLLHLILIEVMVFGLNYISGIIFPLHVSVILAFGIALVFVGVYFILWFIDRRSADMFNIKLKQYQDEVNKSK